MCACRSGSVGGITVRGSEREIEGLSSNTGRVPYIHSCTNIVEKYMYLSILHPTPTYGLNNINNWALLP